MRLALWVSLFLSPLAVCLAQPLPTDAVPLHSLATRPGDVALTGRIGHRVDEDGSLSIGALRAAQPGAHFEVLQRPIRAEADAPPQWFKLRLHQAEQTALGAWVLTLAARHLHQAQCFGPYPEAVPPAAASGPGPPDAAEAGSACLPLASSGRASFLFMPPGPGTYAVYLRAVSGLPQNHGISIEPFEAFDRARQSLHLLEGLSYGLMIGLMLFALILLWTFRDWVYLGFMTELAAATATLALLDGHVAQYLLGAQPALVDRLLVAMVGAWTAFALQRAYRYLGMREHVPRLGRVVLALTALSVLAALAALAGALWLPALGTAAAAAAGLLLLPWGLRPSPKFGYRFTSWYLVTSCWICLLAVLKIADLSALMPPWLDDYKVFQLTVVALCMVFTAMYGDRLSRVWMKQGVLRTRTAELARAAETDPLTRLANRVGLERRAGQLAREHAGWSLLIVDLDHFKPINDRFGHDAGDAVLACVAERLQAGLGPLDLAARLGGDEFALLLAGAGRRAEVALFARELIASISAPIERHGHSHRVGASVGIARAPDDGRELSQLLRRADVALYQAKNQGRGDFTFFEDLPPQTSSFAVL